MQPVEALEQGGHWAEALALQKRLRQSGSGIDASYLHQLGRLYQRCHLDSQSERAYRLALDLDPARIETHCNLALILCRRSEIKDAFLHLCCGWDAVSHSVSPQDLVLLGNASAHIGVEAWQEEKVVEWLKWAVRGADDARLLVNLALLLRSCGNLICAERAIQAALALSGVFTPSELFSFRQSHLIDQRFTAFEFNALMRWGTYRLEQDWEDQVGQHMLLYGMADLPESWRDSLAHFLWQGGSVEKLVLFDDMGIGDALRGLRWLPWLESLAGSISVYLRPSLLGLANQICLSSKTQFFSSSQFRSDLLQANGCGLAPLNYVGVLSGKWTRSGLPAVAKLADARQDIPDSTSNSIGLMWFARRRFKPDGTAVRNERDVPLQLLLDHLRAALGSTTAGFQAFACRESVTQDEWTLIDQSSMDVVCSENDLWGATAMKLLKCRCLVTVDTAIAHLAGLLGCPTILLLNRPSDWSWGDGSHSVLYSSVRIVRCRYRHDWNSCLSDASQILFEHYS